MSDEAFDPFDHTFSDRVGGIDPEALGIGSGCAFGGLQAEIRAQEGRRRLTKIGALEIAGGSYAHTLAEYG